MVKPLTKSQFICCENSTLGDLTAWDTRSLGELEISFMLAKVARALRKHVAPVSTRAVQAVSPAPKKNQSFERFQASPHLRVVPANESADSPESLENQSAASIAPEQSMSHAFVSLLKSITAKSTVSKGEGLERYKRNDTSSSPLRARLQKGSMFDDEAG